MKTLCRSFLTLGFVFSLAMYATPARAAGVVGAGTSASCTEAALDTALTGGGLVTFNCGAAPHTITLTAFKNIIADTTVDGGGLITLNANNVTRHFFINGGVTFLLKNISLINGTSPAGGGAIETAGAFVTVSNSRLANNKATDQGGAIYCFVGSNGTFTVTNSIVEGNVSKRGAGIYNDGCTFNITNSVINSNSAPTTTLSLGGGVYNAASGALTATNSTFSGNTALDGGGLFVADNSGVFVRNSTFSSNGGGYGGGIENSGALTVTGSTITSNTVTGSGGGVWNIGGSISMTRSTVSNNTASEGGGINSYGNAVELRDVNIVNNTATGSDGGGGIWHGGTTFFATNITLSGNRASNVTGKGGGIYQNSSDNLFFVNATIANNSAGQYGGGLYHVARFGIFINSTFGNNTAGVAGPAIYEDYTSGPGRVDLGNSIIFGNVNNCGGNMFNTSGHNIVQGTCASIGHATDQAVTDAKIGPFGFNGGPSTGSGFPMNTFALLAGSPAINWGDPTSCTTYAPKDQRGAARVGVCDAGAVEYGASVPRAQLPIVIR